MKDQELKDPRIFEMVQEENRRQVEKWGIQDRSAFEWLCFLSEEHGELAEAIAENYYRRGSLEDVVKEAIQVATLALKIAEMYQPIQPMDVFIYTAQGAEGCPRCSKCGGILPSDGRPCMQARSA